MQANLETEVKLMAQDITYIKQELKEIKNLIRESNVQNQGALDKKADKWIENAVRYILYTVGGILITAIMGIILIKGTNIQ